ncbi:MAG: hypothetical protein ACKV2O_24155 [Acidimicrobiales bacterium]
MTVLKTYTIARRRDGVTHHELVDYWRGTHATNVLQHMVPDGYTLTFFDPRDGKAPFDGMAELRYLNAERGRSVTGANIPPVVSGDGWADLVCLPNAWLRVAEHVIVAGPGAQGDPATVAEREAAFKLTYLLGAAEGFDAQAIGRHWLDIHVPNFREHFVACGGVRYVVNLVERSAGIDLVGLAELSYRDRASAESHQPPDDGFRAMINLRALPGREMVLA